MDYDAPPYIALHHLERIEPIAVRRGVSEVARSPRGFLSAYKLASGDPWRMGRDAYSGQTWEQRRINFINRHVEQSKRKKESLWEKGQPTRRHLALMMWAFTPTPTKTMSWVRRLR
jgi:hypothetical protein